MKGQASFDNIDELFALGVASVPLNDRARADAALEHLTTASTTLPGPRCARDRADHGAPSSTGLMRLARNDRPGALRVARRAARSSRRGAQAGRARRIRSNRRRSCTARSCSGPATRRRRSSSSRRRWPARRGGPASLLGLARAASAAGQTTLGADSRARVPRGVAPRRQGSS